MNYNKNRDSGSNSDYGMGSGIKIVNNDIILLKNKITNILPNTSLKEISDIVMDESMRMTQSASCYIAYLDPENKDSVGISFSHMTGSCQMYEDMGEARFKIRKDGTYGGLLGYSLDTGESFYIHKPEHHPASHGLPEGHVPVSQFLSVPVIFDNIILGQIVLGNPEKDYTSMDVDLTDSIADIYAVALKKLLY
jgi:GAF domain-containing protein